jgi:DNA mismatch endonuclease (patch repair protein)
MKNTIRDERGRFIKGHLSPYKGIPLSKETKIKLSEAMKGKHHSEETRKKMSLALKGHPAWNKGKHYDLETKIKHQKICQSPEYKYYMSLTQMGKKLSEETKQKIARASKLRWQDPKYKKHISLALKGRITWMKNKHHSEETRKKMSLAHKNKIVSELTKQKIKEARIKQIMKPCSKETKQKLSLVHLNLKPSEETRQKLREARLHRVFPLKDTSIEIALQNKLKELDITFEKHKTIIGQPDIFIQPNICIFADGCYWHGCEQCIDKNKMSNWILARQVSDRIITANLRNKGYKVFRFWEHDIRKNVDACIAQIQIELMKEKIIWQSSK